ncbi:MAG: Rieske (2Fe-2S) protein [Solirubrobacteraceae bacterium]
MSRLETRIPLADAPGPGEVRMLCLGSHRVGLFCVENRFYALADRCPHRGAPLCSHGQAIRGIVLRDGLPARGTRPSLVRCPWHKWDYDIATGRCLVHARLRVRSYRVEVDENEIVITDRHPAPPC